MKIEERLLKELSRELGEEEVSVVVDAYNLICKNNPTTIAEIKVQLSLLDTAQTKLSVIYYLLNRTIAERYSKVREEHDNQYMVLVKRGRPSKDAIEAEIRATCPEYAEVVITSESLEDLKELVSMLLRSIDSNRRTVTEILKNIGRID